MKKHEELLNTFGGRGTTLGRTDIPSHDNFLLTYLPTNLLTKKVAARIIRDLAGVTPGSTRRAGFAFAHTAPYRKFGFTLAEVLITLGIIGVVAAMTLPTLINNTSGKQHIVAFKKTISVISQAVTTNFALDSWDFSNISASDSNMSVSSLLKSRTNIVKIEEDNVPWKDSIVDNRSDISSAENMHVLYVTYYSKLPSLSSPTSVYFNDGSVFVFDKSANECNAEHVCLGFIDVNGAKGPNKVAACDEAYDEWQATCSVSKPTDIYPVIYYNKTIKPSSPAGQVAVYSHVINEDIQKSEKIIDCSLTGICDWGEI